MLNCCLFENIYLKDAPPLEPSSRVSKRHCSLLSEFFGQVALDHDFERHTEESSKTQGDITRLISRRQIVV